MLTKLKNIFSSEYGAKKSATIYLIASFSSFGISILTLPLFTRLMTPEDFGKTLIFLIIIAIVLSIFSFCCYLFQNNNLKQNLKVISRANILYCILTIFTLFAYRQVITKLGLLYFIFEIFIIFLILKLELKKIYKLNDKWANG